MRHPILLATTLSGLLLWPAHAQQAAEQEGSKALDHFVGVWKTEATDHPAKYLPGGGKRKLQESTVRILKDRYLLGRETNPGDRSKSLWLMTFDAKTNSYHAWIFNPGLLGGEWEGKWDPARKTFSFKALDMPPGWTSSGSQHFPDRSTNQVSFWMKDETGALLFSLEAKKSRQPDQAGAGVLADWSKAGPPAVGLAPELKVLDRLAGTWESDSISKPAIWTPQEVRTTSTLKKQWVLDGRLLQETADTSDGQQGFALVTFDPQKQKYRSWWFNSEGHRNKAEGDWDPRAETLSFKADLEDGLVARTTMHFLDKDRHDARVIVTNRDGKVYFDTTWNVRRRKN